MTLDHPKEILKHNNTGEIFHIIGRKTIEGVEKYVLQSQEHLKEKPRKIDIRITYVYFRVVGFYEY